MMEKGGTRKSCALICSLFLSFALCRCKGEESLLDKKIGLLETSKIV